MPYVYSSVTVESILRIMLDITVHYRTRAVQISPEINIMTAGNRWTNPLPTFSSLITVMILPAIQINIRAGEMPPKEDNGVAYAKIPLNLLW